MPTRTTMLARLDEAAAIARRRGRPDLVIQCEDKARTISRVFDDDLWMYADGVEHVVEAATTCRSLREVRERRHTLTPGWDALLQRLAGQEAA